MLLLLGLLAQAAAVLDDPVAALHGIVVDNIRNCPKAASGEIAVCSKDRGFAEGYRLPKSDPRFEKHEGSGPLAITTAPARCASPDAIGAPGCPKDYEAWIAWKRLHEAGDLDRR